jgi:integrase
MQIAILAECPICHKKQLVKKKVCSCGENPVKAKRRKEAVRYWIDFRVNGKSRREYVGYSIEEARDADGKRRGQKRENRIFDMLPEADMTYQELSEWYLGLEKVKALATGFYTGMRRGEILGLTWDKVDLKGRVIQLEAKDTKDKEPRTIHISDELAEILEALPRGIHDNHVFLYRGKPIKNDFRVSLKKTCEEVGIPYGRFTKDGFVFHDLRHTFNTYMRKSGVPESVIMKITGHATREMFDRYNTVDAEDARRAIEQMRAYLANVDQTVDQVENL